MTILKLKQEKLWDMLCGKTNWDSNCGKKLQYWSKKFYNNVYIMNNYDHRTIHQVGRWLQECRKPDLFTVKNVNHGKSLRTLMKNGQ